MPRRLRLTYRKPACIPQRDLSRIFARAFEAAGAVSEGARPRLTFAAPLPDGVTGEREVLEAWVEGDQPLDVLCARLNEALPDGLAVLDIDELGERLPSLQASLRSARWLARFEAASMEPSALRDRAAALLALPVLVVEEQRGERLKRYDLRATVFDLAVAEAGGRIELAMHLGLAPDNTGRPASVLAALAALGVEAPPAELRRLEVIAARPRIALAAWRARGRFA